MRKFVSLLLALVWMTGLLAGCNVGSTDSGKLRVVTTVFSAYDWTRQILGEHAQNAELTLLLDNGVDLHSYQPTADDMIKIAACDVFIYVGGESEKWVEDALANAVNKDIAVINLMEVLGDAVKEEEIVEGMEHSYEHDGAHVHENDEHIWLSLKNAQVICTHIAQQLGSADGQHKDTYADNAKTYIAKLQKLDADYKAATDTAKFHALLFADRFPFRYLVDDYGLSYYAAFSGCAAETEASFETVAFLAGKVDELGLKCVMVIEGGDHSIAKTVIQNTAARNQKILSMNSMQSVTTKDVAAGTTYLSVMQSNLEVLKAALN